MIARTVHNHIPDDQLKREIFANYKTTKRNIPKKAKIMNIDKIPVLV